jgi:hypothetical protein
MSYVFYDTESHGYLEVPWVEIVDLGLEEKISRYSYMNRRTDPEHAKVYLEEDYDLGLFLKKKRIDFEDLDYKVEYVKSWYFDPVGMNYPFYLYSHVTP